MHFPQPIENRILIYRDGRGRCPTRPDALLFVWSNPMTIGDLIEKLGGKLVQGDLSWEVDAVNSCERASAFDLAFADTPARVAVALAGNAGVVVLKTGTAPAFLHSKSVVESDQPRLWFARAAKLLAKPLPASGINHAAVVAPDAILATGVVIGACAVVGSHAHIG